MDLIFHLVKHFIVLILICRGREVESEKLFGLDLLLIKTTLWGWGLGNSFMVNKLLFLRRNFQTYKEIFEDFWFNDLCYYNWSFKSLLIGRCLGLLTSSVINDSFGSLYIYKQ